MFARASIFVLVALLALASGARIHHARGGGGEASNCNTGYISCCNTVMNASDPSLSSNLLGLDNLDGLIGLNCILGAATCQNQAMCCTDNLYNGLVNIGCTPINI